MTTQTPKFAVLGNPPADLTKEISTAVEIQPPTSAVEEIDGLLIHSPTATPDPATLKQHLEAGKVLTFHQPTDEHLDHLQNLVGFAPGSGIPMVSCFKNPQNHLYTVVKGTAVTRNSKPDQTDRVILQPSLAEHLTGTLTALNNPPPLVSGLVPYGPTFTTATWGALRVVEDANSRPLPEPSGKNIYPYAGNVACNSSDNDDKNWYNNGQPRSQSAITRFYADYYVYWTSGDNGSGQPYFYVVRYDNGSFSAGTPVCMNRDTTGYLSGIWQIWSVEITPPGSTSTSMLPSFQSPAGYTDGSNPISVSAPNVPVNFFVNNPQGGGLASVTWTPGSNQQGQTLPVATLNLPGWYVLQGENNSFVMSQKDGWDTYKFPWKDQDWENFYHLLYGIDSNNGLTVIGVDFPQLSAGQIPFSTVWGWQFYTSAQSGDGVNSAYVPPDSYSVSISLQQEPNELWYYNAFFLHANDACFSNPPGAHIWNADYGVDTETMSTLDLAAIVNHKVSLSS